MEAKLRGALEHCDHPGKYGALVESFDRHMRPLLEELLQFPLTKPVRDYIAPDECAPHVVAAREWLTNTVASDDVWFFVYRSVGVLLERLSRKRANGTCSLSFTTVITNCFVLMCNRGLPDLKRMSLRWCFLTNEKSQFESSDAYVHSNASERRKLQMNSVLSIFSERAHKHHFTTVWMQCFEHASEATLHVHLLHRLGPVVLPHLTNPLVVADYLNGCFASGGLISVLALQGLFVLMIDHGLEYPQYYEQLYSLITPDAFASRHRYILFRLLDLSMSSVRVPSYIAAGVIKRVARVSLASPLPTLYFALPFLRKMLQSHPNCLALIHRNTREAAVPEEEAGSSSTALSAKHMAQQEIAMLFDGSDPFDVTEKLASSHAMNSTLWELTALERHFLPAVPLMVSAFSSTAEDKTPLRFEKTYARLFTSEVTRPVNTGHLPTVAYREPSETDATDILRV